MPEPGFLRAVEVLTDALLTPQEFARHKPSPDQMTLRWVTIHPHGDGEEGRRIQINTETGEIEKGFGAGKTMHEAFAPKSGTLAASETTAAPSRKWYGMTYRPPALGAIPKGEYEHKPHPDFRHGQISYNEPLSQEMQDAYELTPIHEDGDIPAVAKSVGAAMGKYAGEYAKPQNAQLLDDQLSLERIRKLLGHVDKEKLKAEFRKQFGQESDADRIESEASSIADGVQKQKQRSMIYQADDKERLAEKHGKPLDAYHDLPFDDWMRIRAESDGSQNPDDAILSKYPSLAEPPKQAEMSEMVRAAAGYQLHGMRNEPDDRAAWREHSQHMTKSAIDGWLMKKFGIDSATARAVSNAAGEMNPFTTEGAGTVGGQGVKWNHNTPEPTMEELGDMPWMKPDAAAKDDRLTPQGAIRTLKEKISDAESRIPKLESAISNESGKEYKSNSGRIAKKDQFGEYIGEQSIGDVNEKRRANKVESLKRQLAEAKSDLGSYRNQLENLVRQHGDPDAPPPGEVDKDGYPVFSKEEDDDLRNFLLGGGDKNPESPSLPPEIAAKYPSLAEPEPDPSKMSLADKLAWQKANPGKGRIKSPEVKPKPKQMASVSGAKYEFVKDNGDGTATVRNEQGDEFSTDPGEPWSLDAPEKSGQVSPSPEKSAGERKPFKPEGIPGEQMGLFDQDAGGQKSLFNVVKPDKKSKKASVAAPSELEKIGDEHKARSEESAPLPGQKSIEDEPMIAGMTLDEAADLASRHHPEDRQSLRDKIQKRPSAWVQALQGYQAAEKTQRSSDAKESRDSMWKPNEGQQKVLDLIQKHGGKFDKDRDYPMKNLPGFEHKAANTQALLKRGLLERHEMGDKIHYTVNQPNPAQKSIRGLATKPKNTAEADEKIASQKMASDFLQESRDEKEQAKRKERVSQWRSGFTGSPKENNASGDIARHDWEKALQNGVSPKRLSEMVDSAVQAGALDAGVGKHLKSRFSIEDQYPSLKGFVPPTINSELDAMSAEQEAERLRRSGDSEKADVIMDAVRSYDTKNPQALQDKEKEDALRAREKERKSLERAEKKANGKGAWLPPPIKAELQLRNQKRREKFEAQWSDDWKPENHVKIAADDISKLRKQDVYRLMENATGDRRAKMAEYIRQNRPELAGEVQDSLDDLGGDSAASEPARAAEPLVGRSKPAQGSLSSIRSAMKSKIAELEAKEASETKRLTAEKSRAKGAAKKDAIDDQWRAMKDDLSKQRQAVMQSHLKEIESHPEYQQEKAESSRKAKEMQAASQAEDAARANDGDKANWEHIQKNGGYEAVRDSLSADIKSLKSRLAKTKDANKWKLESNLASRERDLERVNALNEKFGSKQFSRKAPHEELIHHLHEAMNHDGKCCYEKEEGEDDIADHVPADHRHMDKAVHELCRHLGASHPELQAAYENYTAAME